MIVISGYTVNTKYEEEVKDLEGGLKKYNVPYKLYPYESRGTWRRNTMVKAELSQQGLNEHPNEDVIWIDADAVVHSRPDLFFELKNHDFDLCCHYLSTHYNPNELLSGTFVYRNNDKVKQLVDDWVNDKEINWDQKKLQRLIEGRDLKIMPLPYEYIKINRRGQDIRNLQCIIGHKQLSRTEANYNDYS